jgi:phage portal protein BeeE
VQFLGLGNSTTGKVITPQNSLAMAAVFRSMALLSGVSATLPLKSFKKGTREETSHRVIEDPHPDNTDFETWENCVVNLAGWGNSYFYKRYNGNTVRELWPVWPDRIKVQQVRPYEGNPSGKVFWMSELDRPAGGALPETGDIPSGAKLPADFDHERLKAAGYIALDPRHIFHVPGFGYDGLVGLSPIGMAREAVAAGLSAEEFANRLWSNGALVSGIISTKQKLDQPKARQLKMRWDDMVKGVQHAHEVVVLDSGAEFKQLSLPPEDAQFLQTREFQVAEIARLYGIPPHLLGLVERSTSWGTGIEVQNIGLVIYTLHPGYLRRIEKRVTKELLPRGQVAEFQLQGIMRGDNKSRAEFYKTMKDMGAMTVVEIRELENLPPLTDEQKAEAAPPAPEPPVEEPTEEESNE